MLPIQQRAGTYFEKVEELRVVFKEFDVDGNGVLSVAEATDLLASGKLPGGLKLDGKPALAAIKQMDVDKDGAIDFAEIEAYAHPLLSTALCFQYAKAVS
eukprot:SAG31_NODE_5030_length_2793_cov_1.858575_3_plen_100_part_00